MVHVSVIIPVYNVEAYLRECMDSVVNQTLEDIEIICVNDGSTDSSLAILEEYAIKDDRIIILNQENKGSGAARNTGLKHANGKYISFLDSDDYLELNALKELTSLAENKKLDLVIFKLLNFHDETNESFKIDYHEMSQLKNLVNEDVFNYTDIKDFVIDMDVTVYTKFFERNLISSIKFNEDLIFEDNLFTMEYIFKANRCFFYDKHLYHRRVRSNSIITSQSEKHADVIDIFNKIIEKLKEYGLYGEFKEILFRRKVQAIFMRYDLINDEFKEYFFNKMKDDFVNKKQEYEKDINFKKVDERYKFIFYSVINSNNYIEFDNSINNFELEQKINKLQSDILRLEEKKSHLIMKNKRLKDEINSLKEHNENILNSNNHNQKNFLGKFKKH